MTDAGRIAVTGATGFIGRALCAALSRSATVRALVRRSPGIDLAAGVEIAQAELSPDHDWTAALTGVDCVVHCAARVHVMKEDATDPLAEFRRINVAATLQLARQAASLGVRRFIFLSSIKVNGEATLAGKPFRADDEPAPLDPYGISKNEAEHGLRDISVRTGMEVVIIRPPLVYGPGVKANFRALMAWLRRGIPLPLGAIHNQRSFVMLDNLVDLITICIDHPAAANQTFLVSDGEDVSTPQLLRRLAAALGKKVYLLPVPCWLLTGVAALLGRAGSSARLCGNLQVDISRTRDLLGWTPPMSLDEGLKITAQHYLLECAAQQGMTIGASR